ncbi:MAG: hypothetical protein MN733_07615, partial [Nitrososphaera sp.]|nr:hypothetical protein [Nitrososphaera sp.]
MKTGILLYEPQQIEELETYLSSVSNTEKESCEIIALGVPIEYALGRKNISFVSGRDLRSIAHMDHVAYAAKMALDVMDDRTLDFFQYRGVRLTDVYLPVFQLYLQLVLYFVDVFVSLVETKRYERIVVFPSTIIPLETSGTLAFVEARAADDAARVVAQAYHIELIAPRRNHVLSPLRRLQDRLALRSFAFKRFVFGWGIAVLNFVIGLRSRAKIRVVASDYWRNIGPLMREMPEGELFLFDRLEALKAG